MLSEQLAKYKKKKREMRDIPTNKVRSVICCDFSVSFSKPEMILGSIRRYTHCGSRVSHKKQGTTQSSKQYLYLSKTPARNSKVDLSKQQTLAMQV